jgi:hypothetical protein
MKLVRRNISRIFIIGVALAIPSVFIGSAHAQNQNMTPSMVINMSDLSIKVGNSTSNETITFSNNTDGETGNGNSTSNETITFSNNTDGETGNSTGSN